MFHLWLLLELAAPITRDAKKRGTVRKAAALHAEYQVIAGPVCQVQGSTWAADRTGRLTPEKYFQYAVCVDEKRRWTAVIIRAIAADLAITALICIPSYVSAWNSPTHMITGAIAYQTFQRESPSKIITVALMLQRHPWYAERWRVQLDKIHGPQRMELLFMLAARWADDVRKSDRAEGRPQWHYINFPFKPEGEPIETKAPASVNILTAIAENKRILRRETPVEQRAIALAWLFHLVGDVHQPLHTAQMFTREYPNGDRGGNEICVRVSPDRAPLNLHALWDGLITSTKDVERLRKLATETRNKFSRSELPELANAEPDAWAKEGYVIAVESAYQNGSLRGTPKGKHGDCRDVSEAAVLPSGYAAAARHVADRRIVLAGYRLASLLDRALEK